MNHKGKNAAKSNYDKIQKCKWFETVSPHPPTSQCWDGFGTQQNWPWISCHVMGWGGADGSGRIIGIALYTGVVAMTQLHVGFTVNLISGCQHTGTKYTPSSVPPESGAPSAMDTCKPHHVREEVAEQSGEVALSEGTEGTVSPLFKFPLGQVLQ